MNHHDALVIVDVQNDFCPGGALAVENGDRVVATLNRWIEQVQRDGARIVASRDWHPPHHVSFQEQGGPWPAHCLQDRPGAEFHPDLKLPEESEIVSKGMRQDADNCSAFDNTALADELQHAGVERVWIAGLAQDVCVRQTALDAPEASENGYYRLHFLRAHTFLHVQLDESTIKLAAMSPKWLESYLKKQPDALDHTTVSASGHAPPESEQAAAERLVVTAPTENIQSFLLNHLDTEGAFGNPIELKHIEEE